MKLTVTEPREVEAAAIRIVAAVRYEEEDMPNDYPHRKGETWDVTVDMDTGQIRDWPEGVAARDLYMKVCDEGSYYLLDKAGAVIRFRETDYVPSCIPGSYGDYIDFSIDDHGLILDWKKFCTAESVSLSFVGV